MSMLSEVTKEAKAAMKTLADVEARYEHHCDAARALVAEHFDSDKVLTSLVERAMG